MTEFGARQRLTISIPVTLAVGDSVQDIATFRMPQGGTPPTRKEIARVLRTVADMFDNAQEGVHIPQVVSYLDRP